MSDVKQRLRKAVLNQTTVRVTLHNGEKLRGMPERNQNLRFDSNDSPVTLKDIQDGQGSPGGTKRIPVSEIKDVELLD